MSNSQDTKKNSKYDNQKLEGLRKEEEMRKEEEKKRMEQKKQEEEAEAKKGEFIETGEVKKISNFISSTLRIRKDLIKNIEDLLSLRVGMNRHAWILEAIQEKIKRDNEKYFS